MAVKWELVKSGDLLWDYHSHRIGNTMMRGKSNWSVRILSIDHAAGTAVCSWNSNPAATWHRSRVERLRRTQGKAIGLR